MLSIQGVMMELEELVNSKGYRDASDKVRQWKQKIETAEAEEIMRIRTEKRIFFSEMKQFNPDLYAAFRIDDKRLGEIIMKKLHGDDVVID